MTIYTDTLSRIRLLIREQMMQYWVVVAKGISLLQMAFDAPSVGFFEGAAAIQRQKANLQSQYQVFRSTLGIQTTTIAERVLNSGNPIAIPISFCDTTGGGVQWIQCLQGFAPRVWVLNDGRYYPHALFELNDVGKIPGSTRLRPNDEAKAVRRPFHPLTSDT